MYPYSQRGKQNFIGIPYTYFTISHCFFELRMVVMVMVRIVFKANLALVACRTGRVASALFFLLDSS